MVHLVRNSNLHGNSLLFSDLNLRIGIHWGELSLHELYDHHGFFFTTIKSCEFLTRFKCFEYYESYFIRHPSSLITPNNRNKILWWNDEFYFLLCSCSNWFGFRFNVKFGTGFIFSMNKIFNDHLEHSEIKQTLFHLHHLIMCNNLLLQLRMKIKSSFDSRFLRDVYTDSDFENFYIKRLV